MLGTIARTTLLAAALTLAPPALAQDDPAALRDEAFQAAQWALSTSAGRALAQMSARFAAGNDALAGLVRQRQDFVNLWQAKDQELLEFLGRGDEAAKTASAALQSELDSVLGEIGKIDVRLGEEFPEYSELVNPKPLAIADVQEALAADEAMILTLVTPDESYVWAISRDRADWVRVEVSASALEQSVRALRATLDPTGPARAAESLSDSAPDGPSFDRSTAFALYRSYLQPLEPVFADRRNLLVVADGAFTSLPLSVLVASEPAGEDADPVALQSTDWLIRKHAITTLPAVSSLKALRGFKRASAPSDPFRGFGAPTLKGASGGSRGVRDAGSYFKGRFADVEAVRALAPLPQTAGELRGLARALGAEDAAIVIGDAATESAVKAARLDQARVIAFATHGLVSGDLQGLAEPALVFTPPAEATAEDDGLLTASEAAQLKLAADWVILSACNTASSDGTPGADGLSGLARAFIYAGARAILVSHWPVRDDAAAALTQGAFRLIAADPALGRAEALRRSMIELMESPADPTLAHPSAWAPFVVVGEGGVS